jgi:hypothetical protein
MTVASPLPPQVRRDPRDAADIPARDYIALQYIMEGYQEAQANVDAAVFGCSSKTPSSRCVQRLVNAGYIVVERWNGVGMNLLRGTNRGRTALTERGVDPSRLFVPERPVAAKDLPHHLWINDVRLVLRKRGIADVTPCWALRRKLAELRPPAIPDVLAFTTDAAGATAGVLAVEVDMGTEPLKLFLPKMDLLRSMIGSWASDAPAAVLVLTVGPRRILAMEAGLADRPNDVPAVVLPLPKPSGRQRVAALASMLAVP